MVPTLLVGDELIASKFPYGYSKYSSPIGLMPDFSGRLFGKAPERGDVIVFRLPRDPSTTYVKRLIGLPGDRIQMQAGRLYINGALVPRRAREVVVLAPPVEEQHAAVLAFLADGESWSSSALAIALGTSPRTVQRALDSLAAKGKAHAFGRGRARRWIAPPVPGFPTLLLLPAPLPS